jgi:hypothetical protein
MQTLKHFPYHVALLPAFFVVHASIENYGAVSWKEGMVMILLYTAVALAITMLGRWLLGSSLKSGLVAALAMSVYFFFPALQDFLLQQLAFLHLYHYRVLLPACAAAIVCVFIYQKKRAEKPYRFTFFLNLLLLIFLAIDIPKLIYAHFNPSGYNLRITGSPEKITVCDTCEKPDIFLLLMDEYASSLSLEKQFGFHNDLDSFLLANQFSIQQNSRSNYNYTVFSMSSIFNMGFVSGISNIQSVTQKEFALCEKLVRENAVHWILQQHGYDIINYSGFNFGPLKGDPLQPVFPTGYQLINSTTLLARLTKDKNQILQAWAGAQPPSRIKTETFKQSNEKFERLVCENAARKDKPRFVYAHFMMPHFPFYYDEHGNNIADQGTAGKGPGAIHTKYVSDYLGYVKWTNRRIKNMILTIREKNPGAVILLLGDHGFRVYNAPERSFDNLNAVYYPDQDYQMLYDSITCVNQFRVLFNKLFHLHLPLQTDATILLKSRQWQ